MHLIHLPLHQPILDFVRLKQKRNVSYVFSVTKRKFLTLKVWERQTKALYPNHAPVSLYLI